MHLHHWLGHGPDRASPFRTSTCISIILFFHVQMLELLQTPYSAQWAGRAYSASSAADDGFDRSNTIVLPLLTPFPPSIWPHFSLPCPASPPRSAGPAYSQSQPVLASELPISVPPASSTSAPAPPPKPSQSNLASLMATTPALTAPPDVQALMKDWQDAFFKTMQDRMQVLMGDAPPHGFLYSTEYGPQRAAAVESLW